ncbi:hypothetical protein Acr_29g0005330 [Actinidia rufa]|uniref:Uncharacterized protein n=1 Tax=Actinidia rufa TaxID=165716 RepID=A0A7J0HEI1_9ERIC|nr:hypothetical protein Acr_29g0005330 [Actinidia rufa]
MPSTFRFRPVAVRGNLVVQVTFCPLICLVIPVYHCISNKLRRSDPAELAIEQQLDSDACPNFVRASVASRPDFDAKTPTELAI